MPLAGPPEEAETAKAAEAVESWLDRERGAGSDLVAAEREEVTDRTAAHRWYLRFRGEEKEYITVWLTLRQRTLHHEAQFMPAPEENVTAVLQYLMRRNAHLLGMAFCLGPEDAVYLVGRVPAEWVTADELDRIVGSSITYVDEHFPTAMSLAHPSSYRRRRSGVRARTGR
jgi:Putative bacterial sensory transduction regulator